MQLVKYENNTGGSAGFEKGKGWRDSRERNVFKNESESRVFC